MCNVDECDREKVLARGMCGMHYARWLKYGTPGVGARIHQIAQGTICSINGCENPTWGKGLCLNCFMTKRRTENRDYIQAIKLERGCIDCGFNKHPAALHFDHVSGKKRKIISKMCSTSSKETIDLEIAKCEVRCANCHAIRTFETGQHKL